MSRYYITRLIESRCSYLFSCVFTFDIRGNDAPTSTTYW